jgi:hypothetical protein
MTYTINPDRETPWNSLPKLPIDTELYRTVEIYEQLANAKAALGRLQGRSAVIPNQGLLINTISLQEAKASSAIENIFTTDDELYKAYSEQKAEGTSGGSLNLWLNLWIAWACPGNAAHLSFCLQDVITPGNCFFFCYTGPSEWRVYE